MTVTTKSLARKHLAEREPVSKATESDWQKIAAFLAEPTVKEPAVH